MTAGPSPGLGGFLGLSGALTGFSADFLEASPVARSLADAFHRRAPAGIAERMLAVWDEIARQHPGGPAVVEEAVRARIWGDEALGPYARSLVKLWYLGAWHHPVPTPTPTPTPLSAEAYAEGLIWPAIGAGAQGAHAPGLGDWSTPPPGEPFGDELP
ncbi:MAG TPA: hypothetical protein VFA20_06525 [Myxococcaceae bacterium]|nr:hypothetical protein [Myxococcaceae bacterium]